MIQSNMLLKCPDHIPDRDEDNEEMILLSKKLFLRQIDLETHDVIIEAMTKDDFPNKAITTLKEKGMPLIKSNLVA